MEIYLITNTINGRQYVGKTRNTKEKRWEEHLSGDLYVDHSIRFHKKENFTLETLEYVYDESKLNDKEKYWIKKLDTLVPNGYNILPGGDSYYGRKNIHEFNAEQYLKSVFYPPKRRREAVRCKIYIINSSDISDLLYKVADFEPFKSKKPFNQLTPDESVKLMRLQENFEKEIYNIIGHENLCSIAKRVTYAPSMSYIVDNPPYECDAIINLSDVSECVHNHKLLRCTDWIYDPEQDNDYLYITPMNDDEEYDEFVNNEIKNILKDWDEHPEKLKEISEQISYLAMLKSEHKDKKKEQEFQNTQRLMEQFLRLYANRVVVTERDNGVSRVNVNLISNKFNTGDCESLIDALVKAKNWLINILNLDKDAFEQYYKERIYEDELARKNKYKEWKEAVTKRRDWEEQLKYEKDLRKS